VKPVWKAPEEGHEKKMHSWQIDPVCEAALACKRHSREAVLAWLFCQNWPTEGGAGLPQAELASLTVFPRP